MNLESPPPDFVGYENLISFMETHSLHQLDGDLIEVGAFMGGGTIKLAEYARKYGRKVYVVDLFEPTLDQTLSKSGETACSVYEAFLDGRSMQDVYQAATRDFDNIITVREDSKRVRFDNSQKYIFGFIDGCHQESYVLNDFHLIWPNLVSGGILGLHDYRYDDWPEVTQAIEKLLDEYQDQIGEQTEIPGVYDVLSLMLVKK